MRKLIAAVLLALLAFTAVSCRQDITQEPDLETLETYEDLFTAWWYKMDRNYLFWNLDSPGSEWDDVYSEYIGKIREYGNITGSSAATQEAFLNDLYDIVSELSDGHFSLHISLPDFPSVSLMPSAIRTYAEAGAGADELRNHLIRNTGFTSDSVLQSSTINENTANIIRYIFGINIPSSGVTYRAFSSGGSPFFKECGYLFFPKEYQESDLAGGVILLGLTDDDILYLGFSNFFWSTALSLDDRTAADGCKALLDEFTSMVKNPDGIKGVVVDIRGNGGGAVNDLSLLWTAFISEEAAPISTRGKKTGNRLSYTSWEPFVLEPGADTDFPKPIALLVNCTSASCSEFTTYAFKCFRDELGLNTRVFGEKTLGAQGPLIEISDEVYGSGTFYLAQYIEQNTTPFRQMIPYDGIMREGIGIEPDEKVQFSYSDFVSGSDSRLEAALSWVRSQTAE